MANVFNTRDTILQAAGLRLGDVPLPPNFVVPGLRRLDIDTSDTLFRRGPGGIVTPSFIRMTAVMVDLAGQVDWSIISGTAQLVNPNGGGSIIGPVMNLLAPTAGDGVVVRASVTYNGQTFTSDVTINVIQDGVAGSGTFVGQGLAWSDVTANNILLTTVHRGAVFGDLVTIFDPGGSFVDTKMWNGVAWINPGKIINGNLIIGRTVSGDVINGGVITGSMIWLGSGHTPGNVAFELGVDGKCYIDTLRCGSGYFRNDLQFDSSVTAILGETYPGRDQTAVWGTVQIGNFGSNAHAIRGINLPRQTGGLIGAANGYDFYADQNGTNYGPFTGTHDALIKEQEEAQSQIGDIVVDVLCVAKKDVSGTLFLIKLSSKKEEPSIGVLCRRARTWTEDGDTPSALIADHEIKSVFKEEPETKRLIENKVHRVIPLAAKSQLAVDYLLTAMNAVGEGQINVCGMGGPIKSGDFICASNLRGKGMRQESFSIGGRDVQLQTNYTVAKAREDCSFNSQNEVKMIPCIYLCG